MTENQLKHKADELWFYFERNIFKNEGIYPYNTNLAFAFSDYFAHLDDNDIQRFLATGNQEDVADFRLIIRHGLDCWLKDFAQSMALR